MRTASTQWPLNPTTILGILLISLGIMLILLPLLSRYSGLLERLSELHPIILWIYRSDGFVFATSPLLLIISAIVSILYVVGLRS